MAATPHRLLVSASTSSSVLIVCFHGSGETCSPTWDALAEELSRSYRVLLVSRGDGNPTPESSIQDLLNYLNASNLPGPFVAVAHSYGGTFARHLLHRKPTSVAGMVLVETGQETPLDAKVEERQYKHQVLGRKPLSVVRGNSFIAQWKKLEADEVAGRAGPSQRSMLEMWDAEDDKLKRAQLALSRNHRFVTVPGCGHHVIRDRPDIVAQEVRWVVDQVMLAAQDEAASRLWKMAQTIRARLTPWI